MSLAGHLIECGAQCTGGICSDWDKVPGWEEMGFPMVEYTDGTLDSFTVLKPEGTGGLVNFGTVAEQLVYEIGDPRQYQLPDVVCDFSRVAIEETSKDNVTVSRAIGLNPTDTYKVSATYVDGYRCTAVCPVIGPRAAEKAVKTANAILNRCRRIFKMLKLGDFSGVNIQTIGSGKYSPFPGSSESRECCSWIAVEHKDKRALEIFAREIAPAGTGMAPGLTGIAGGRPKASPVLKLFSFYIPKEKLKAEIFLNGEHLTTYTADTFSASSSGSVSEHDKAPVYGSSLKLPCRLGDIAYTRSGDKGDSGNIGVVARKPEFYPVLLEKVTVDVVKDYFAHLLTSQSTVQRFELPGINGLNFLMTKALGGGGIASLRFDPQGKALGQMLSDLKLS